jgi:hypothetical protein
MPAFVRTQELEHGIGEAGSFALRVTSAAVQLRGVDGAVASLRATFELRAGTDAEADAIFDRARLQATSSSDTMEVSEPRDGHGPLASLAALIGLPSGVRGVRIDAAVPRQALLRYSGVSADLTETGFGASQRYQTISGDLVLTDVAGSMRVRSVSGSVSIRATGPIDLEATSVSGDLSVAAPRIERMAVNSVSGDIEVDAELAAGSPHRVETVSGDFGLGLVGDATVEVRGLSTDVDIALPHRTEGSRDRRRYVVGGGGPLLAFGSMSGDLSLHASRRAPPAAASATHQRSSDVGTELEVLRALERGEIDVDEAARRLGTER